MNSKHFQFLIAVVIVVAMPLFMKSGSLASEVLIYALAAMACNLLLCIGKLVAGTLFGSIAIMADALNNLSDASSNVVSLVGFKLAGKSEINANPKDTADHPNGVWTLPPVNQHDAEDDAMYQAIGESDRMTLRFVKPKNGSRPLWAFPRSRPAS